MINNENLEQMYKLIVEGKELTTKELYNCGLTQNDLTKLVNDQIIKRVKRGYYQLLNLSGLNDYAKKFIFKDNDLAIKIFEKSYLINEKDGFTLLNLFKSSLENQDKEKILEYLNAISNLSHNNYAKRDYYVYVYLLQYLMDLPEIYKEQAEKITYEDLKIPHYDIRIKNNIDENEIRLAIFERDFKKAFKLNNSKVKKNDKIIIQDIIITELIKKIFEKEKDYNQILKACILKKEYKKIIELIYSREKNHKLSTRDELILILCKNILKIKEDNKFIIPGIFETNHLEHAVLGRNYKLALELKIKEIKKEKKDFKEDLVYLLLYEICSLQENMNLTDEELQEKYFKKVIKCINNGERRNAKLILKEYLKLSNNTEYQVLLISYFELLEFNLKYQDELIMILNSIKDDSYKYNVATIIGNYYLSLNNNLNEAKVLLKILQQCKSLTDEIYDVKQLEEALYFIEKKKQEEKEKRRKEEEIKKAEKEKLKEQEKQIAENKKEEKKVVNNSGPSEYEIDFVLNKRLEIIETNEVVLLRKMEKTRYRNIEKILKSIPDITYFYAGRGDEKRMFLRYSSEKLELINVDEYLKLSTEYYEKNDFENALFYLKELLNAGVTSISIFYKIGVIYFKLFEFELASRYLTITNLMNKEKNGRFDITDFVIFVDNLKAGKDNMRNYKPKFPMELSELIPDVDEYYGINNFEELNESILESGLDVETYCLENGYSIEEIDIIKLIYAKLYYYKNEFELGDKFLNSVIKIKDKSILVRDIQNDIIVNRNYYGKRNHESDLSFIRKLKP